MTTEGRSPQEQLDSILSALQTMPYDAVESALASQLKAVDDWAERVGDQPHLRAMAGVLRAQIHAAQTMVDVQRREGQNVANAMRQATSGLGGPPGGAS